MAVDTEYGTMPAVGIETEQRIADECIRLGAIAMRFARVERTPRHADGRRETDVEHSYMLSLIAAEIAAEYYPDLEPGLVAQFANVHDLVELHTGDVPTFAISAEELAQKSAAEREALKLLLKTLPPHTAAILERYERQEEAEARLVRAVDKLLPLVVDTHGDGIRVLCEDYRVTDVDSLIEAHRPHQDRFKRMFPEFPELLGAHVLLTEFLVARFAVQSNRFGQEARFKQDTLF